MPYVRPALVSDAFALAPNLRAEDAAEVRAVSGKHPETALLAGILRSEEAHTIVDGDTPIGVFGVVPMSASLAGIWLLASPALTERHNAVPFLRQSRAWCARWNDRWDVLFNYVDARNETHLRWLEWCGCIFIRRHATFGVERRPFYEFVRINHV